MHVAGSVVLLARLRLDPTHNNAPALIIGLEQVGPIWRVVVVDTAFLNCQNIEHQPVSDLLSPI